MNQTAREYNSEAQWVLRCLENILRPIVRILFNYRIGYQSVLAVIRRLYVEMAYETAASKNPFKQPTVSSISLSSGVEVKDVKHELDGMRQRGEDRGDLSWLPSASAETKILEHWAEKPPFVDENGEPVILGGFGPGLTFERLVKRVCGNVGPAELRDRLYKAGCIEILADGATGDYRLKLVKPYFTASSAQQRKLLEIASASLRHLATTLDFNLSDKRSQGSLLQQERWTRRLRRADVQEFRRTVTEWVRERITESESTIESFEKDPFDGEDHIHAGVGFYYFEEDLGTRDRFMYAV